jgi:hypothetical protein
MNNFLNAAVNRAKKTAKTTGNLAYKYLGGQQFADANRMSNKIMRQGGGVTDVLKNPEYWKTIAGGTVAASSLLGVGGLGKAVGGKVLARALPKKPPVVTPKPAPQPAKPYKDPFADDVANPYGLTPSAPASTYNPGATRAASNARRAAEAQARREAAAAEAQAFRDSMRIIKSPKPSTVAKGTATTAATGAAASTQGPKPKSKIMEAAKPKKPKTGGK